MGSAARTPWVHARRLKVGSRRGPCHPLEIGRGCERRTLLGPSITSSAQPPSGSGGRSLASLGWKLGDLPPTFSGGRPGLPQRRKSPLDSPPSPSAGLRLGLPAVVAATEIAFRGSFCRCGTLASRAYSSIGQSPRLITGPFLVRTQVGPPACRRPSRAGKTRTCAQRLVRRTSDESLRVSRKKKEI
jgi:hypothetical protein